jgi:glycosyltransferase involved in cell wall biosynthesis
VRIAQVVESLAIGGLERVAVDLAIAQKAAGHHPFLYCVTFDGPLAKRAEAAGVPVTALFKKPGFSAQALWQLQRQLRADRIEVVHTHNSIIHHYGAAAARLAGVPVVNTQHGLGAVTRNRRQLRIFRATIPLTAAVVFVAEEPKRSLWEQGGFPPAKARVILNGIPLQPFAEHPANPGASASRIRFGTVGRMVPIKDHATLVRAFAALLKRRPNAELHIVGYGALETATRQLAAELGLGDRFRVLPAETHVPAFLSGLDVFVISSQSEALPLCVLEAMAARLPLVSTRVGGIPEVAPEHQVAWYCPAGDVEAMTDALAAAASSGELRQRGLQAAEIVGRRFGIDTMLRRYEELYAEVLPPKRRP